MTKKIRKSVMATSLAAATLVTSAFNSHVNAEESAKNTDEILKNDELKNKDKGETKEEVTLDKLSEMKEQVDQSKDEVAKQEKETEAAKQASEAAQTEVETAEKDLADAQKVESEATEENIAEAESEVSAAKEVVAEKESKLEEAKAAEEVAKKAVQDQEAKVAEQTKAVEAADAELKKVASPLVKEEQAIQAAKDVVSKAETDVKAKESAVVKAEADAKNFQVEKQNLENQKKAAEAAVAKTSAEITAKEAEVAKAERNASNRNVVRNAGYAGFLSSVNSASFSQAMTKYSQNGINVNDANGIASLQNALRAVDVMKKVNEYRRRAGLNELYVDVTKNVESQIQTVGFDAKKWHTNQYFGWENVAWGFNGSTTAGVDYWYNEKGQYQALAGSAGLTTNETQLDPGTAYNRLGGNFSPVGHYVTMMGKDFNSISAAAGTVNGQHYIEAGFHKATDVQAGLRAGTLMSVADYEKALRSYISNANTDVNLIGLSSQLSELKKRRDQESKVLTGIINRISSVNGSINNQGNVIASAKSNLVSAQRVLAASKAKVAEKQTAYNTAMNELVNQYKPQSNKLATEKARLEIESTHLTHLQTAQQTANGQVELAKLDVQKAQANYKVKADRLSALQNATQTVEQAKVHLEEVKEKAQLSVVAYETQKLKLEAMEKALSELSAKYEADLASYQAAHPEIAAYDKEAMLDVVADHVITEPVVAPGVESFVAVSETAPLGTVTGTGAQFVAHHETVVETQATTSIEVKHEFKAESVAPVAGLSAVVEATKVKLSPSASESHSEEAPASHEHLNRKVDAAVSTAKAALATDTKSKEAPASVVAAQETTGAESDDSAAVVAATGVAAVAMASIAGVALKKKD